MMNSQENALEQGQLAEEQVAAEAAAEVQNVVEEAVAPAEEPAVEEAPAEEPAAEEAPAEEPAAEEAPAEEPVAEEAPAEEPAAEEAPAEEPVAEEAPAEEPAAEEAPAEEPAAEEETEKKVYTTKQEVLDRVKEIAHSEENPQKDEVDLLKTVFYKLHIAEREQQLKEYIDGGGDPDNYVVRPDDLEEMFKAEMNVIKENKAEMNVIKEKRAKVFQAQEAEKQENLKKKLEIIEKIKGMATSPDEANRSYQQFKELQQQWRDIKAVPAEKANELWRNYQLYVEQFYDLLKLNNEAREYDFKKNLELKTKLCEAAEVISAFHQLQELHAQYREIGPVAKDLREEVWARFKAASTIINKRHQQHFESLRAPPSSTSATSSTSRAYVPARKRTCRRKPSSARRWKPLPRRRTRAPATGRSTPSRSSSAEDEREDLRALPCRLRRFLHPQD